MDRRFTYLSHANKWSMAIWEYQLFPTLGRKHRKFDRGRKWSNQPASYYYRSSRDERSPQNGLASKIIQAQLMPGGFWYKELLYQNRNQIYSNLTVNVGERLQCLKTNTFHRNKNKYTFPLSRLWLSVTTVIKFSSQGILFHQGVSGLVVMFLLATVWSRQAAGS